MNSFFIFVFLVDSLLSSIKDLINHGGPSTETLLMFALVALFSIARQIERIADNKDKG